MARFEVGCTPWNKGMKGYGKGHKVSQETREKISKALKKENPISKENDLIRRSWLSNEWRKKVFERDKFTCQNCGSKKDIHPHHIKLFSEYPELRFDVDNGKTLCAICHGKLHNIDFNGRGRHLTCKTCGKKFKPQCGNYSLKTCSKECGYKYRNRNPSPKKGKKYPHLQRARVGNCLECGKKYRAVKDFKDKKQKYCSVACYLKTRWGFTGKKAKKVKV